MAVSFLSWIGGEKRTFDEKGRILSFATIGGAIAMGLLAGQELGTSFLSTIFAFVLVAFASWGLIFLGSFIFTGTLHVFSGFSNDERRKRATDLALGLFIASYIFLVFISLFDGWRLLASL